LVVPRFAGYHLSVLRTRVKICGICGAEDAAAAARAGADAIGVNFDPTVGRSLTLDDAAKIVAALPPMVGAIGVFVNATAQEIRRVAGELALAAVQLHGEEPPELVAELKPLRVIKAVPLLAQNTNVLANWERAIGELELTNLLGILLETANGPQRGGTGIANDFNALAEMRRAGLFDALPPIIAAGGLTPENVGEVVRMLRPFAVDVSSGVESARRQKSAEKIEAFVRAVREADKASQE
jgi:phosphoribosylanthranilate isomerase